MTPTHTYEDCALEKNRARCTVLLMYLSDQSIQKNKIIAMLKVSQICLLSRASNIAASTAKECSNSKSRFFQIVFFLSPNFEPDKLMQNAG